MPGSQTTPGYTDTRHCVSVYVAFRYTNSVGARDRVSIAAQWLAYTSPCQRFVLCLTATPHA